MACVPRPLHTHFRQMVSDKTEQTAVKRGVRRDCIEPEMSGSAASRKSPKSSRLLKHTDFQRVYQCGRRQFTGNMTVFFLRRNELAAEGVAAASPRVGLTVGKVLGGAVERNRIKRRMREAVRLSDHASCGPVDVIFHPRKSVLTLSFAELATEVSRGLRLAAQRARVAEPGAVVKQK
jgi:ribonuclease P protein component